MEIVNNDLQFILQNLLTELKKRSSPWMTGSQCCEYLQIQSKGTLTDYVSKHDMPCHYVGKRTLYNRNEIDEWLKKRDRKSLRLKAMNNPPTVKLRGNYTIV